VKALLICGPWGSGTTAVAGLAAHMGAVGFDPYFHFRTNDPRTPDSYEFAPFRELILRYADEPTVSLKPFTPEDMQGDLRTLQQRIERQEFGQYDIRRPGWIILKYPLATLLAPQICEAFETKIVHVMRPLEQIEQSRLRRRWPPIFGSAGAAIIYRHMSDLQNTNSCPMLTIKYPELLASPLDHARRLARFVGLKPTLAQMKEAVEFVVARP
jgi:hypothetical protein